MGTCYHSPARNSGGPERKHTKESSSRGDTLEMLQVLSITAGPRWCVPKNSARSLTSITVLLISTLDNNRRQRLVQCTKRPNKRSTSTRRANSPGQDSAVHLNLKDKGQLGQQCKCFSQMVELRGKRRHFCKAKKNKKTNPKHGRPEACPPPSTL